MPAGVEFDGLLDADLGWDVGGVDGVGLRLEEGVEVGDVGLVVLAGAGS